MTVIQPGLAAQTSLQSRIQIQGKLCIHESTKQLLRSIEPECIAVLCHDDLDELAAEGLIQAKVRAVVNMGRTMTGKVPTSGCWLLFEAGIPIVEIEPFWYPLLKQQREIYLTETELSTAGGMKVIPCSLFTKQRWLSLYQEAHMNLPHQLNAFIENTLAFAQQEKDWVLERLFCPELKTDLKGRHVLVVIRGYDYKKDLAALGSYILHYRPILLAVDGGADALLEHGFKPDLIVGDMDSVSDEALSCGAELIVHAYRNGHAPGLSRLQKLGLEAVALPACGTSEDMAMLMAYDHECEHIVTVGAHSHMYDFLQKGRQGMGSTLLVRMKIGSKLTDAKGISVLLNFNLETRKRTNGKNWIGKLFKRIWNPMERKEWSEE